MSTPIWALSLAYWLHMLATVVWIGGLAATVIFVLPVARKVMDVGIYASFLSALQRRLDTWGWFSLAILAGTGMVQMSANPNYQGFLAVDNRWTVAILLKHLLFLVMAGISAYLTWGVLPQMQRLAMRRLMSSADGSLDTSFELTERLQRQEDRLLRLNLALAILILALTAVARSAS